MRKSDTDTTFFSERTRQSYVAILLIIYKTYRIIVRQAWPFLIYFFIGGGNKKYYFLTGIIIMALFGMIYSIIKFFRYYFYIRDNELIIEQGVFGRAKTNVPFDRIQTINFEQNIIHRIFNVVMLKVDTAGSTGNELEFQAIDHETANSLREILLAHKSKSLNSDELTEVHNQEHRSSYRSIMKLELPDLLKAGMVENHLKSGGLIFAFVFWIWQGAGEIGMEDMVEGQVSQLEYGLMMIGFLILVFGVISFIISMVRMVIKNYDLKFLRSVTGFKINAGLFTKRDISALDHKIQVISWADNPLKKLIGIKDLRLKQAASKALNINKSIRIPGCDMNHIEEVTRCLYGDYPLDRLSFTHIHPSYFHRIAMYVTLIGGGFWALFYWIGSTQMVIFVSLVILYMLLTRYLSMTKKRYAYNDDLLVVHGGTYGDKTEVLPIYKIQSFAITSSPYQRRKDLASLVLFTASGRVGIPYIPKLAACKIVDHLLYKVEVDKRKWM